MATPITTLLRSARLQRGLTQREAAALLGVHYMTVGDWERGRYFPALRYHDRICEVLGIPRGKWGRAFAEAKRQR